MVKFLNLMNMNIKALFFTFASSIGFCTLPFQVNATTTYIKIFKNQQVIADVIRIDDLAKLQLLLNDQNGQAYKKFYKIQKAHPECSLSFAMNAGMYHADFSPVGLYVEHSKQLKKINLLTQNFGNFFLQPNGVVAWDHKKAIIQDSKTYAESKFKANFATQSGPMLVMNGVINSIFKSTSSSLKIRNGVGIKNNQLYFVISRGNINFYDFADIFKTQLKINQALYLDGSISSAYIPQAKRHDQVYDLGPMFMYTESKNCHI